MAAKRAAEEAAAKSAAEAKAKREGYERAVAEFEADTKLRFARELRAQALKARANRDTKEYDRLIDRANAGFEAIVKQFPDTQAARDSKSLLANKDVPERPAPVRPKSPE